MSNRYWPIDVLGNEIRKNNLLSVAPGAPLIMKVVDVVEAGVMPQEEGKPPMVMPGHVTLLVQLPYHAQQTQIPIAVVVKEPEEQRIHRV